MDNPLLKYSAKDYFFKAALCHFIVDELNAKVKKESFSIRFLVHITHGAGLIQALCHSWYSFVWAIFI